MNDMGILDKPVENPLPGDLPVHKPLASTMNVDLMVNEDSKLWVIHDKPFPDILIWAEYDADMASLSLIAKDGKIIDLGMKIHQPLRKYMLSARQLFTMRMQDGKIDDCYVLPLIVRETVYQA